MQHLTKKFCNFFETTDPHLIFGMVTENRTSYSQLLEKHYNFK